MATFQSSVVPISGSDPQLEAARMPPHSVEAEQSVLGGLLLDNTAFEKIGDVLTDSDFYRSDHRRIFRHIARLIERGRPADVVTVEESIKGSEDAGGERGRGHAGQQSVIKIVSSGALPTRDLYVLSPARTVAAPRGRVPPGPGCPAARGWPA